MKSRLLAILFWLSGASALDAQVFVSENFNAGLSAGWTIVNGGSSPATWYRTTGGFNGQYLDGSEFMFVNSDGAGNVPPVHLHEILQGPTVNTAGHTNLMLEFDQYFHHVGLTDSGHVEVFDGSVWRRVASYANNSGAFSNPAHVQLTVGAYSNANFSFRFVYDDDSTWAWYWAIDNVALFAPVAQDAGLQALLQPSRNGRELTSLALSSTELVQVRVANEGTDTLNMVPLFFQVDQGPVMGPETLAVSLLPGQSSTFSFTTSADLSAVGNHQVKVWTALQGDANPLNDTLRGKFRQLANPPLAFPHCLNFESLPDTTLQSNLVGMPGLDEMDFSTNVVGAGRMRSFAGAGFAHGGNRAITLDRNPSGSPDALNFATFTWNMSGFSASTDVFLLDFWLMEHGDEVQLGDSVWVRGCDTCQWLRVLGWNNLTGGANGIYLSSSGTNVSNLLNAAGQDYSSSFQLRIGQQDNFAATSLSGSDGMSFDDICLKRVLPLNAGVTALLSPALSGDCGDSANALSFRIKNLGTNSLVDIPVFAQVGAQFFSDTLAGPLASGATAVWNAGTFNGAAGGAFNILAWTAFPGDLSQLDDSLLTTVHLAPALAAPQGQDLLLCLGDSGWVSVLAQAGLSYHWYDSLVGGSEIATGDSLLTGAAFGPQHYFVEAWSSNRVDLGPLNNQMGLGANYTFYADGLVFNALQSLVIDSVTVYPNDTGVVTLVLRNSANLTLDSVTVWVFPSFPSEPIQIPVGIAVDAGTGYKLSASGSACSGLFRNSQGANYPYTFPGVASITGPINALSGYYYFFYDWVLSYELCPSPRAEVIADTTTALPLAAFLPSVNGLQASFSNLSSASSQYFWDFGDGNTSISNQPQHLYATDGSYWVCLIATGACGSDTICDSVSVNCLPMQASWSLSQNNLSIQVIDSSQNSLGQQWHFGDGQTATGNPANHSYAQDGIYQVCLEIWNVCGDTLQDCDSIAVCGPMTPLFGYNAIGGAGLEFEFFDQSFGSPLSWTWDFGDGASGSGNPVNHLYATSGSYVVTMVAVNLCGDTAITQQQIVVTGMNAEGAAFWQLWPNPAREKVYLNAANGWEGLKLLECYDAEGKLLQVIELSENLPEIITIDLQGWPSGAYWLVAKGEDGQVVHRLKFSKI